MGSFRLGPNASAAGYRLVGYESVGSTNIEANAAAQSGDVGDVWFVALEQTAGRGRRGRQWLGAYGNLAASLLVKPNANGETIATLGFVAGVALHKALQQVAPDLTVTTGADGVDGIASADARIALKWPNDVLIDGAKITGILLEAQNLADGTTAVTVGIGVNVRTAPKDLPYPATCLADLGIAVDAQTVHTALAEAWVEVYDLWRDGQGMAEVLSLWRERAAGIGAPVAIATHDGTVKGTFETVDDSGRLVVKNEAGERVFITAGDVHFGATASLKA